MKVLLFVFIALSVPAWSQTSSRAQAWATLHNSWLEETKPGSGETWEDRYSRWVKDNVTSSVFTAPDSPLYGIKVDCAKSVYAIRMLFAYQNGLPFAVENGHRAAGGQFLLTNEAAVSGATEQDRFKQFVRTVLGDDSFHLPALVNTSTLSRDTYPVSITGDYVTPGKVLLYYSSHADVFKNNPTLSKHSHTLHDVSTTGVPLFLSATETIDAQDLKVTRRIMNPPLTDGEDGLRGWNSYRKDPATGRYTREPLGQEPGSKEFCADVGQKYVSQFDRSLFPRDGLYTWGDSLAPHIGSGRISPFEKLDSMFESLCDLVLQREDVVNKGISHVAPNSCASFINWEKYSTVSTDEQIWNGFQAIDQWVKDFRPTDKTGDNDSFKEARKDRDDRFRTCAVTSVDKRLDLRWLRRIFKKRWATADPADSKQARWGLFGNIDLNTDPNAGADYYDEDWEPLFDKKKLSVTGACSFVSAPNLSGDLLPKGGAAASPTKIVQAPAARSTMPAPVPAAPPPAPKVQAPQNDSTNGWAILAGRQN